VSEDLPVLEQWLSIQRVLVAEERRLAALAERYARAEISRDTLDRCHKVIGEMRDMSEILYQRALQEIHNSR
jgi:hypothetical protein